MQAMKKPLWVLITITLPQCILLATLGKIFSVIRPLMSLWQINGWKIVGAVILVFAVSTTAYAVLCLIRKKEIVPWFGVVIFSVCIPLIYISIFLRDKLVPASVPSWMMFDLEPVIVLEALTVPALAYAMLLSVFWLTPRKGETKMINDVVWAVSIPFCWYLFFVVIIPLLNGSDQIFEHTVLILLVLSSVAFLFFLTRIVFIFLNRKPDFWKKLILPVVLIFPLLGLAINLSFYGVFGNFSHPGFFIAAAVCGVLLILPEWENPRVRMPVFLGKMLLFPYTIYFFLVFLPYVPVAIPAIIGFGTGFLILTPTLLFLIHIRSLHIDFCYLREHYNIKKVITAGVLMGLILPLGITAFYYGDRVNLGKAMAVAVNPSYQNDEPMRVNRNGIRRTLSNIQQNTARRGSVLPFFSEQIPLLSAWYRFIVTDNLSLSSDKVKLIEQVILGTDTNETTAVQITETVKLDDVTVESAYDANEKAWRSWVHLTLKNTGATQAEYLTEFKLPEGCYISDYYLDVNGVRKYGLLADKRAAEWIYRQITAVKRDPGLLRYIGNNRLELRVFPFSVNETRWTGFEIIHREPEEFSLDGKTIRLAGETMEEPVFLDGALYLPAAAKEELQSVVRENEWFFLVDCTDSAKTETYLKRAEEFIRERNLEPSAVNVFTVNDNLWKVQVQQDGLKVRKEAATGGGFYADKAIKTVLYRNYTGNSPTRPVFVLVTDDLKNTVMRNDFDLWQAALPEGDTVYHLNPTEDLYAYRLGSFSGQTGEKVNEVTQQPVLAWPDPQNPRAYLSKKPEADIISSAENSEAAAVPQTSWETAVLQRAEYFKAILHPEKKTESQFKLVQSSIASGILSPYTAYIVLENEAQENMLKEKQKQILAAKSDVDLGENLGDETVMAEPGLVVMAVLFIGAFMLKKKKK